MDESGEGTYHGFAGTAYAGSGSYSQSSRSPNGSSSLTVTGSALAFVEETSSGFTRSDWNTTQTSANYSRTDVGFSSQGTEYRGRWEEEHEWSLGADHTGLKWGEGQVEGRHEWEWLHESEYSNTWTETWSFTSGSGSGSGSSSGSSWTSSGSSYFQGSSGSGGLETWSNSWSYLFTPDGGGSSSSGSGGTTSGPVTSGWFMSPTGLSTQGQTANTAAQTSGPWGNGTGDAEGTTYAQQSGGEGSGESGGEGASTQSTGGLTVGDHVSVYWNGFLGFWGGLGRGGKNIVRGVKNMVVETATMAVDTIGVGADTVMTEFGHPIGYQVRSDTGQAVESGQLSLGRFYGETAANMVTFGVYSQVTATVDYLNGDISTDEYGERLGAAAAGQLVAAGALSGTQVGTMPIQRVPGHVARSTARGARALWADESGSIQLGGGRTGGPAAPKKSYNISTAGLTTAEAEAILIYAQRTNAWLAENGPQVIRATAGELRKLADAAARAERLRAERAGEPYRGQAAHVPDTAITGMPEPPAGWLDMPGRANSVAGGGLSSRIGKVIDSVTVDGQVPP